jgi:hypothetical protein
VSTLDVDEFFQLVGVARNHRPDRDATEIREIEDTIPRQNHRLLDHVLELTDVPGPVVLLERLERPRADPVDGLSDLASKPVAEVPK